MIGAGINSGDIIIVDRSIESTHNKIIVAELNGEFAVKRYQKINDKIFLVSENPEYKAIEITQNMNFVVWGVVLHVIHSV